LRQLLRLDSGSLNEQEQPPAIRKVPALQLRDWSIAGNLCYRSQRVRGFALDPSLWAGEQGHGTVQPAPVAG